MKRRFFLAMTGATLLGQGCHKKREDEVFQWDFVVFGITASVILRRERRFAKNFYEEIRAVCLKELFRLESIFSLYDSSSSLVLLNSRSFLKDPPAELLKALEFSKILYEQTEGVFDPSIQSYWFWLRERMQKGGNPSQRERSEKLKLVDFSKVKLSRKEVALPRGFSLTLNGLAQGLATDHVADLLSDCGIKHALVNVGEYRALGRPSEGDFWKLSLTDGKGGARHGELVSLHNRSLAVSRGGSYLISADGRTGHILNACSGGGAPRARQVVIEADSALVADGLATVGTLFSKEQTLSFLEKHYPEAQLRRYGGM